MNIAILGGGVSGLSLAYFLEQNVPEANVTLYESSSKTGGLLNSDTDLGFTVERGPDSLFTHDPVAHELSCELGLQGEIIEPRARRFLVANKGELLPVPDGIFKPYPKNVPAILSHSELSGFEKLRVTLGGLFPLSVTGDDISVYNFFAKRFGAAYTDKVLAPLLGGVHSANAKQLSTAFLYKKLWKERGTPAVVPFLKSLFRPKRLALPSYFSFKGGNKQLVDSLRRALKRTKIEASTEATSLRLAGDTVEILFSDGDKKTASHAFLCIPPSRLSDTFRESSKSLEKMFDDLKFSSTALVTFLFPKESAQLPPNTTGFIVPESEGSMLSGVTFASQKWPERESAEIAQIRVFIKASERYQWQHRSDEEVTRDTLEALKTYGVTISPSNSVVDRWEKAQLIYELGHQERLSKVEALLQEEFEGRVSLLGTLYGSGVPACIRRAKVCSHGLSARAKRSQPAAAPACHAA